MANIPLQPQKRPHLIRQTPQTTLWHKKDDRFWVPKASVIIDIRRYFFPYISKRYVLMDQSGSLASYNTPRASVLTRCARYSVSHIVYFLKAFRLYADLVTDALTELAYDAELAGLSYSISDTTTGLYVFATGYNDKISTLVKYVLQKARQLEVKPDRLEIMKELVSPHVVYFSFTHTAGYTVGERVAELFLRAVLHLIRLLWSLSTR